MYLTKLGLNNRIPSLQLNNQENVGAAGSKFSGGERQRLSLIRAIMHNPNILLLDEITSALDVETEFKVLSLLNEVRRQMNNELTLVWTSHRLSTLIKTDKIFVLDEGQLKEEGTHKQLLDKKEDGI
mmetsp:Transcript_21172/g.17568  ORF Transcript_21172/g.17568 Transcript_21172/m.17568 type:complete len:127 (+) Transcript_21172:409-789(+)